MHLFIFKLAVVQLYGGSPLKTILERLSNTPQHLFKILAHSTPIFNSLKKWNWKILQNCITETTG